MDRSLAEQLTRELDIKTSMPAFVDLVFVFGTKDPDPAMLAGELALRGCTRHLVLTGGRQLTPSATEADIHLDIVLKMGVPRSMIVLENRSANTLENVANVVAEVRTLDLPPVVSIAVATKWYHCRRAMMTLKRHLPFPATYYGLTYERPDAGRQNWWESAEGVRRVQKELRNIPLYLAKGDIAEIQPVGPGYR